MIEPQNRKSTIHGRKISQVNGLNFHFRAARVAGWIPFLAESCYSAYCPMPWHSWHTPKLDIGYNYKLLWEYRNQFKHCKHKQSSPGCLICTGLGIERVVGAWRRGTRAWVCPNFANSAANFASTRAKVRQVDALLSRKYLRVKMMFAGENMSAFFTI